MSKERNIVVFIRKCLHNIGAGETSLYDISPEEQIRFMSKLPKVRDDIDRSYNQYLCQFYYRTKTNLLLLNVSSAIAFPFYVIYSLLRGIFVLPAEPASAVGEFRSIEEIVPDSLNEEYGINNDYWFEGQMLSFKDIVFIFKLLVRHPLSPYFIFKCTAKLSFYSYIIRKHRPKAIIVHNEYSFTSSVLTTYCDRNNVKHINVMHGEKLFYMWCSYFRYYKCYVWAEHYKNMFVELMADPQQFVIELPPSLRIDKANNQDASIYTDYTYYLQIYDEQQLKSILSSLSFIEKEGKTLRFRPHPRFSNLTLLEKYVDKSHIEDPHEVSIVKSLSNTGCAIGFMSTVLYQAYLCNTDVILDDMTYHEKHQKLVQFRYIMCSYNVPKLSQFQKS